MGVWPSFRHEARSAESIVVGEVVRAYFYDSADNATMFAVRVDETLRGRSDPVLEFREGALPSPPLAMCPDDSILRVRVGDVIAFAFEAPVAGPAAPLRTVAFVRGKPHWSLLPGVERLTMGEVRRVAALPETATLALAPESDGPSPLVPLAAVAVLSALVALRRTRRSET